MGSKEKKLATKVKPLFFIPESWTLRLVKLKNLPYVSFQCPLREKNTQDRAKKVLELVEKEFPGFKKNLVKTIIKYNLQIKEELPNKFCKICGFPSNSEICSFCKIKLFK